ncbi:hypothetical protein N8T08_002206 [Aspergillus melleus]|uniref:Uncharacterized protein n=1 Tax=Aspergillus melleus TaxID=138277 RepID=A0ACC3B954_9EURO|nr:hypothetical protein N8T08_002206 [Aspergillus melleus]
MSTTNFNVTEHTIPAGHIREYAGSTANSQEDVLQLHVKQYTPKEQSLPLSSNAVTIVAAHGVALAKELYEPLWDEIWQHLRQNRNVQIRSIWIADMVNMGGSGILNEDKLSTDFSWMDCARDLLLMVNHFRDQMPRPIVGVGHSFGGTIITNLAYLHPRLFTTVILLDPVIQLNPPPMGFGTEPPSAINFTLYRPDVWPNRKAAMATYAKIFPAMDPRCLERAAKYMFRDLPTALHPNLPEGSDASDPPVTLTTTKYQDLLGQIRENFSARALDGSIQINRRTHADMDPLAAFIPMYRPEPRSTFYKLPSLRPSALWLLGGNTYLRMDEIRQGVQICGTGVGGSGGISPGRVMEVILPKAGHLFPFENVAEAAEHCFRWLDHEMAHFIRLEREWEEKRRSMSKRDHLALGEEWYKAIKPISAFRAPKPKKDKL